MSGDMRSAILHVDSTSASLHTLDIEVFVLRYFIEKEEKKKYVIHRNCSFVGDYDYIAFRYDYTWIIL